MPYRENLTYLDLAEIKRRSGSLSRIVSTLQVQLASHLKFSRRYKFVIELLSQFYGTRRLVTNREQVRRCSLPCDSSAFSSPKPVPVTCIEQSQQPIHIARSLLTIFCKRFFLQTYSRKLCPHLL